MTESASAGTLPITTERDQLITALAELLGDLGPASLFHLHTALTARQVEGVSGTLEVVIPRKGRDHVDVKWHGGL